MCRMHKSSVTPLPPSSLGLVGRKPNPSSVHCSPDTVRPLEGNRGNMCPPSLPLLLLLAHNSHQLPSYYPSWLLSCGRFVIIMMHAIDHIRFRLWSRRFKALIIVVPDYDDFKVFVITFTLNFSHSKLHCSNLGRCSDQILSSVFHLIYRHNIQWGRSLLGPNLFAAKLNRLPHQPELCKLTFIMMMKMLIAGNLWWWLVAGKEKLTFLTKVWMSFYITALLLTFTC